MFSWSISLHIVSFSFCHRQMLLADWNEKLSRRPNHVCSISKQAEQELLANFSTMGLPISCSGYLTLAATAKATSNIPPTSVKIPQKRFKHYHEIEAKLEEKLACVILRNIPKSLNSMQKLLPCIEWQQMTKNHWFMIRRELLWK